MFIMEDVCISIKAAYAEVVERTGFVTCGDLAVSVYFEDVNSEEVQGVESSCLSILYRSNVHELSETEACFDVHCFFKQFNIGRCSRLH